MFGARLGPSDNSTSGASMRQSGTCEPWYLLMHTGYQKQG